METWKGAAIGAMAAAFIGYAAMQNRPLQSSPPGVTDGTGTTLVGSGEPMPTATPDPALTALIGTEPIKWSFPASAWANVKKPLAPADLKGKVTLLEFWRMGCSHCEEAVPFMNALRNSYGSKLQIITFQSPGNLTDPQNMENSWPEVQKWMKQMGVAYPVAFDEGRKLKNQYPTKYYPFVLLVGPDGKIVYTHTGHTPEKAMALSRAIDKIVPRF